MKPSHTGKLSKFDDFDVAHVLVLEDLYSHMVRITAKKGRIKYGVTEEDFCNSNFEMQQVSETWKV